MKAGKVILVLAVIAIGGAVLFGGCLFGGYNKAVRYDEAVRNAWSEVDNQLQRRFELIPNLQETVKGMAQQEKDIFLGVAEARQAYTQAQSVPQKVEAANQFESALARLLVIQERYPELRSNESFLKFQDTLEGTENRLSVARQRYNEKVAALNQFVRAIPGRFYAKLAGVGAAEYYKVEEAAKTTPKVDFSKKPAESGGTE